MEHLQHFGLVRDPFCNEPIPELFQEIGPYRDALLRLERAVNQRKGLCVLTGEVGAGKTMVARRLLEQLEEEVFEASMMVVLNATADAMWIMTRFARQLGIEEPPAVRDTLVAQIYEHLAMVREEGRHAVLLIDDAQALASDRTLAEVCGLLKLEYEERRLLTLVLAGGPQLGAALAADPSLAGRIEVRVELAPLSREAAHEYLARRIQTGGGAAAILHEEAMDAIHQLSGGLAGRMNTLADNALFEAFLASRRQMTRADVERAYADLAWSAPATPLSGPAAAAPAASVAAAPAPIGAAPSEPAGSTGPLSFGEGAPSDSDSADISLSGSTLPPLGSTDPGELSLSEDDVFQPIGPGNGASTDLDSELDAAFAIGPDASSSGTFAPPGRDPGSSFSLETPVKDEEDELLVELIEE